MGASAIEFRLRMVINAAIIILGFWAPWIGPVAIGRRISLLEWLALQLSRVGARVVQPSQPLRSDRGVR